MWSTTGKFERTIVSSSSVFCILGVLATLMLIGLLTMQFMEINYYATANLWPAH